MTHEEERSSRRALRVNQTETLIQLTQHNSILYYKLDNKNMLRQYKYCAGNMIKNYAEDIFQPLSRDNNKPKPRLILLYHTIPHIHLSSSLPPVILCRRHSQTSLYLMVHKSKRNNLCPFDLSTKLHYNLNLYAPL